jgi:transposase InsO family protein
MPEPQPTHQEAVSAFRLSVVGDLLIRELDRGELTAELKERSHRRYRPPGSDSTRTFHWKTLQAWLFQARRGVHQLRPQSRKRGYALALDEAQRQALLDVRRAHPTAAAELILSEAVRNGLIADGQVSAPTLRRLFRANGLSRDSLNRASRRSNRRRWSAREAGALWHADVCHVRAMTPTGTTRTWKVHALIDDRSRYVVALGVCETETEVDLLRVLCTALMQNPAPGVFYVDNGSCYRGDVLAAMAQRLEIRLVHAKPYDPEARGLMERFWRTMRQQCTDHLEPIETAGQLENVLWAYLDSFHRRPHGGLMGKRPRDIYLAETHGKPTRTAASIAKALEQTKRRRVRKDATLTLDGVLFETEGWLAGKLLEVRLCGLTGKLLGASRDGKPVRLGPCDPVANASRERPNQDLKTMNPTMPFHPVDGWLIAARELDDV